MALPLKKDPYVYVTLAMRSPFGVTAKQVHGSDPELRVLGKIAPQPIELLFIHGDTSERQYTIPACCRPISRNPTSARA